MKGAKETPKTLEDCTIRDKKAELIDSFSGKVIQYGSLAAIFTIVCGIIIAIDTGNTLTDAYYSVHEFSFGTFLITLLPWIIASIGEYIVFNALAYMLVGISEIMQNTKESRNLAYYKLNLECNKSDKEEKI